MNDTGYKITASRVVLLLAVVIFAVAAFQGGAFISLATGLTFFAAALMLA